MNNKKSSKKKKNKLLIKIARGIYNFFSTIYRIIDKIIITPLAKLMMLIMKIFKTNNKPLERLLNNKIVLITFSLILSLVVFFTVDSTTEIMMNKSADILYGQKVTALYNEEAYVVEGLPKEVDITLIGRKSELYLAKQFPSNEVTVDLRGLKPGSHKVSMKYTGTIVDYKLDPSVASIIIYEKMSESRKLAKEVLYEEKLDSKYSITNMSFSRDEVYIKGAEYKLEQVAVVKALVDVTKIVNPSVGTTTLKEIPLVAYDKNGEKMDVEIVPSTVDATVEIASPSKVVPIRVIPEGNPVFGKSIDAINISETSARIYGDEKTLANISNLPVSINIEGISKTTEYNVNISLPSGVSEISTPSLVAKVTLANTSTKTIKDISIATKNLSTGLVAQAASKSDSTVDIILKGTTNNLKSITADSITAYVDLKGLSAGTHDVEVKVTGEDLKLTYTPKTTTVTIVIKKS